LRSFAEAQETWNGGSQQKSNNQENNHELDYREKILNVFMPRHSCKKTHIWTAVAIGPWSHAFLRREILSD